MAITIDCANPKDLLQQMKCLSCLSELQLKRILFISLNDFLTGLDRDSAYNMPEDTATLISDSACYTCMTDKQMLEALIVLVTAIKSRGYTEVSDLVSDMGCFQCSNPKQVKAALMKILCLIATYYDSQ